MNRIVTIWDAAASLIIVFSGAPLVSAAVNVELRERVAPHASVVRLADVADVTAADRQVARKLAATPLMPLPASGTERFLTVREIQDMLAVQGVDIGDVRFGGAAQVAITAADDGEIVARSAKPSRPTDPVMNRHAAILSGATIARPASTRDDARSVELRQLLKATITNYLNTKSGKIAAWKIELDVADLELERLNGSQSAPVCSGGSEPWTGRQRFLVSFSTAKGLEQFTVFAEVTPPPVPVVVAVRPIGRGDVIKAADVELRTVDTISKPMGQRAADSVEKLIGMESRQSIQAGDIILTDQLQAPIVVKRGELITITSQSGGIRVRTSARALHDGAQGELVQVESIGTKQKYDARIIGPREAAVFAMSRPAAPKKQRVDLARAKRSEDLTQRR
jgi:flagella basal body P-ring formation protein FlgA